MATDPETQTVTHNRDRARFEIAVGAKRERAYHRENECTESTATNTSYFELGAPLAVGDLARLKRVTVGTSRLRARYHAALDGRLFEPVGLWRDETLGAPLPVMHRGDASIVSAWTRYGGSWGRWRSASTYRQTVLADWRSASRLSRGAVLPVLG